MTLQTVLLLIGLGAVVVTAGATVLRVSPWWVFGLASITTVVTVVVAAQMAAEPCNVQPRTGGGDELFQVAILLSLTLYAAATLGALIDGIRLGKAGERNAAFSRFVACPLASAFGVGVVLYAFLLAIAHCLG